MNKNTLKQKLSMMLIISILISMLTFTNVFAIEHQTEVPEDYIPIYTAEDLDNIRNDLSGKYILMSDVNLESSESWTPIGSEIESFTGIFDGNGYTVSNVKINGLNSTYIGFITKTEGAKIKNLDLINVDVAGNREIFGGLVGRASDTTITNCYVSGRVSYSDNTSVFQNSFGGLVGQTLSGVTITNCYSDVDITGEIYVGGLVGRASDTTITNSYSVGSVSGETNVGGLVGLAKDTTITNSYSVGSVSGETNVGGLVGQTTFNGIVIDSYYNSVISGQTDTGKGTPLTTTQMKQKSNFTNWDFTTVWKINEGISYPTLRENVTNPNVPYGYIPIYTAEDLDNIRNNLGSNESYILMADIDLAEWGNWTPIGGTHAFKGIFNGNGYTISNVKINEPNSYYVGFFGYVGYGGKVKNLGLINVDVVGREAVGGLAGYIYNETIVANCYTTGKVGYVDDTGFVQKYFGGLVGQTFNGAIITNCYSDVDVDGEWNVGGLVGGTEVTYNTGAIIENSYATGSVSGESYVGGLVGDVQKNSTITNSYSIGSVSGESYVGGLVGKNSGTFSYSYYNSDTSTPSSSGKGEPLTTSQMKQKSSFGNWNFTTVWKINEGISYPTLQWQGNLTDSEEPETPDVLGSKIVLKRGTNSIKLDDQEIKISTIKAGEKDVGTYLTLYKKVLEDVDASQNNKLLTKINNFLTNLFL